MEILIKEDTSCYASGIQKEVLGVMSGIDMIAKNFFLTGGTALSVFYFHHRSSEDIDFFSTNFRELNIVDVTLRRIFKNDVALIQSSPEFCSYLLKEVKADFVFDPLSTIEKRPLVSLEAGKKIFIDTLANISSNKLSAIVSRFEAKDIVDFYFISKNLWRGSEKNEFLACYDMARKKEALLDDPAMAAYQIEELLNHVLSKKGKILPLMRKEIDWSSFEKDLRFYIDIIYRMENW
jgi:predicted nucleotidyltransferase component of viral defense system